MSFTDRADAGRRLARRLTGRYDRPVVLGLPRGGVPVAAVVAASLGAPLDVIGVRRLDVPHQPDVAMGVIGEHDALVLNERVLAALNVDVGELSAVEEHERSRLDQRLHMFRRGRPHVPLCGRVALVVDDGITTGSTAHAACRIARAQGARRVVVAVPVAPPSAADALRTVADDVVCLHTSPSPLAISDFYDDFPRTSDDDVVALLAASHQDAGFLGS